jgi:hypothetical protein
MPHSPIALVGGRGTAAAQCAVTLRGSVAAAVGGRFQIVNQSDRTMGFEGAMVPQRCQWLPSMTEGASSTTHHRRVATIGQFDLRRCDVACLGPGERRYRVPDQGVAPMQRRDGADGSKEGGQQGPIRSAAQRAVAHRLTPKKQIRN